MSQTKNILPFMERMHVLGSGSIGLLFACSIRMAFPSFPLSMLLRPHHRERLQHPLNSKPFMEVCIQRSGRPRMVKLPAEIIEFPSNSKPIYNLLLAAKAPDACKAVSSIVERLDANARIIILCNGALAVQEELAQLDLSDGIRIHLASTTHGAYREESEDELFHVVHAGVGQTFIEDHPSLARLWDQSGLVAQSVDSDKMTRLLWHKLAANCVINPLTALLRCENGQLLKESTYQKKAKPILQELLQVAQQSTDTFSFDELESFVLNVIRDTAHNKSSMLQDVLRQKPTEIKYLNGYIVRKGIELGLDVTANQAICSQIEELTQEVNAQ
jgi:2-dehydropantoate 2-reductase